MKHGHCLGPYRVLDKLGEGGMGEVYRARDTQLDRDVALKILPESFAADPDRLARFDREAKTLAALNHPHIAQIYGLEHSSTTWALVMELVDGEDLAQRIARDPLPLEDALTIAKQIADGLEAAHESIIHRDLKPPNIKVTPNGTVKMRSRLTARAWCFQRSKAVSDNCTSATSIITKERLLRSLPPGRPVDNAHGRLGVRLATSPRGKRTLQSNAERAHEVESAPFLDMPLTSGTRVGCMMISPLERGIGG